MSLKRICLAVVIISLVLFAVIALLSIWQVITNYDLVWKSLTSLAVVGFSGLVGVAISERLK
jgi:hypothetical protein